MKKVSPIEEIYIALVFALVVAAAPLSAQDFKYDDSWGKQGFQLNEQKSTGVEITYSIRSFSISKQLINGEPMDVVSLPGILLPNDEGAPNLPGSGRFLALPEGSHPRFEVIASRKETFSNVELAPAPRIPKESETAPPEYKKDESIYGKDAFYPANPVMLSEVTEIRGVDVATLGITPFQYNPVTRELIVYRDLKIKVEFTGGNGHFGDDRLRSRWWDPMMADMFLNFESLPKMNYDQSSQSKLTNGCEYLIITPTGGEFLQWADSIKNFRTKQGIKTEVITVVDAGGNDVNNLENFFNQAYQQWDEVPAAVLLLGDYGVNPANRIISPVYNDYCVSDNMWADVSGNHMPDMIFARISAENADQLEVIVTKFLDYERNPPTNASFYQKPITALGFQTARWFQICSESIAGFWENEQGRTPSRINKTYSGNPSTDPWSTAINTASVMNVFGPDGLGYLPATPSDVNCTWEATAQDVVSAINEGAFMLQHRDHGEETGWGEPNFQTPDIESLNNTELTFVWSVNCLTGKFNLPGECFAEKFQRYTYDGVNSGALGLNAATEESYSFVNDAYVWGAYDYMWPDFLPDYGSGQVDRSVIPAFGMVAGKYFLQQSGWPYNDESKQVTYYLFHHFGDAFTTVYTDVPTELAVSHDAVLYAGVTTFDVTANENALIALTVNGEIIGTAEGTGAPVTIIIPGQDAGDELLITVTLQDYYRYEKTISIVTSEGPYVVHKDVEINDEAGNSNGIMETAEYLKASITVGNVGLEAASGVAVTLSSADEYLTITDGVEFYGDILSGSSVVIDDAFAWKVANDIPDMHTVDFEVSASDGAETWNSYFSIKGHAPVLEIGSMSINDENGNGDGRLDPGEEVEVTIETLNTGSFPAGNLTGTLVAVSNFISIPEPSFDLGDLPAGESALSVFTLTVSSEAPIGSPASLFFEAISGEYSAENSFPAAIGMIVEDWETGKMDKYDWTTGGDADWYLTSVNPFEGNYAARSGSIGNNGKSWLELEYHVFGEDMLYFSYKVSSEYGYDYLRFFIDGEEKKSWSGQTNWTLYNIGVPEGLHTFRWEYEKDYSEYAGSDCAWLDFIVLPAPPVTTAFAGIDDDLCAGETYEMDGMATLYNLVTWTTSGSGTFDDEHALEAVYTPGESDIDLGSAVLTLTAFSPDTVVSDSMTLTIALAPEAYAGEDKQVCSNVPFSLNDANVANQADLLWSTSGDGSFNDNSALNPIYLPGENDALSGSVTLTLKAMGGSNCDMAIDEVQITLAGDVDASAGTDDVMCIGDDYPLEMAYADDYASLFWTTSGDGSFDDETVLNPVYTPGISDASIGQVSLSLSATAYPGCEGATSSMVLSLEQAPEVFAGMDNEVTQGDSYLIADAWAENAPEVMWSTAGDGSFDDPALVNATYTPGANDIESKEVLLTLGSAGSGLCEAVSDDLLLSVSTGIVENVPGYEVRIYPNPGSGKFVLEVTGTGKELIRLQVFNILGDKVYNKENIVVNGTLREYINLDVDRGIYFLQLGMGDHQMTRKISVR